MINISNAFKNELYNGNVSFLGYADITLSDDTILHLTNENFWNGGVSIEDAVSNDNTFEIGSTIINKCTLTINNIYDDFSDYDFSNAKVIVYIGLELPDGTTEKIRKGTYTVDETQYDGSIISLSCLDNMSKFDKTYTESSLQYPATLNQIVLDACNVCGVSLQTYDFPHDDFLVNERPNDEAVTFREIIGWCAQIACCFCRCDTQGRLELKWYDQKALEDEKTLDGGTFDSDSPYSTGADADGGTFDPWNEGYEFDSGFFDATQKFHHIYSNYSSSISTDDVVITGVRILEKSSDESSSEITTYQTGTEGYIVSIENNELIKNGAGANVVGWIGKQIIGFRFRKAQVSHTSNPSIEAGDVGFLTDRKQKTYRIIISSTNFATRSSQSTSSSAETPLKNSASRFSESTKNYVDYRKEIQKERTDREEALEELGNRIDESSGLFTTEKIQGDGSTIFYLHNKPQLSESNIVWKMTAEAWGVSTDGGKTYNAGMTVDGDTITRILTATGINADWIKTGAFTIEKDGKIMFKADTATGQVDIVANSFSLKGQSIEEIANQQVNDFVDAVYTPGITNLQAQIDGQIETYYYDYEPTLTNEPASEWTTETERQKHEGDLFYWKSKGYAYRFFKDGNTWKWQMVQDTDITAALEQAAQAQDTADQKRRVFVSTPVPPYDVGDLWTQGPNGDIMRCQTSRQSGAYNSNDWVKASKYTDNTFAQQVQEELKNLQIGGRNLILNTKNFKGWTYSKAVTFREDADGFTVGEWPDVSTPTWNRISTQGVNIPYIKVRNKTITFSAMIKADVNETDDTSYPGIYVSLGLTTGITGQREKYHTVNYVGKASTEWNRVSFTIEITDDIFTSGTGTVSEDKYFTIDIFRYNLNGLQIKAVKVEEGDKPTDWSPAPEDTESYTDDKVNSLDTSLNQQDIFNRLTNNGQDQGIYLKNNKIYVNASYIQSGTLRLGGINNQYGVLQIMSSTNTPIGTWGKDGINITNNGTIRNKVNNNEIEIAGGRMDINYSDTDVGFIGSNLFNNEPGLVFDLQDGNFMTWSVQSEESSQFVVKFYYIKNGFNDYQSDSLNVAADMYFWSHNMHMQGNDIQMDGGDISDVNLVNAWVKQGSSFNVPTNTTLNFKSPLNMNSKDIQNANLDNVWIKSNAQFVAPNNSLVDFYTQLNMHGYAINNTSLNDIKLNDISSINGRAPISRQVYLPTLIDSDGTCSSWIVVDIEDGLIVSS